MSPKVLVDPLTFPLEVPTLGRICTQEILNWVYSWSRWEDVLDTKNEIIFAQTMSHLFFFLCCHGLEMLTYVTSTMWTHECPAKNEIVTCSTSAPVLHEASRRDPESCDRMSESSRGTLSVIRLETYNTQAQKDYSMCSTVKSVNF